MNRDLNFVPCHFIKTHTPATPESKQWIQEKLRGRYSLTLSFGAVFGDNIPAFEDPEEATFYELTWS
jgi:hypothetical protein